MATSKNNAAKKKAIPQKLPPQDIIELDGEVLNFVSYATYFNRIPLFTTLRIFNNGEKDLESIFSFEPPKLEAFYDKELRREFDSLTARLKSAKAARR